MISKMIILGKMEMFIHHEGIYMKYNARETDMKTKIYMYTESKHNY